jgi:periplasmic copper chaperone A
MRLRALMMLSVWVLCACGGAKAPVEIRDARSPPAPPGAQVIAVYATIVAQQDDTLLSVTTPFAREAQLHSTVEENGMMKMRHVVSLPIKAGETVELAPGGLHLMLMEPDASRASDTSIPLTFHFERAGSIETAARITNAD